MTEDRRKQGSYITALACSVCGREHSHLEPQTVCTSCGKSLVAKYDLKTAAKKLSRSTIRDTKGGMWKYFPLLPVLRAEHALTLGEVESPVVPLTRIAGELGLNGLWMKDEGELPTGSFKARGLAMALSKAKELGIGAVCIPSAGNAAGASAAYAARAGIACFIFLPRDTPTANIKECRAYGARIEFVDGTISDAAKLMNDRRQKEPSWFDVSTLKEPYRLEGKKTMGFEIAEQFDWDLPDFIVYPTGGGTGLIGMWKAFAEMEQLGWIGPKRPKMIAVQSDGCAPVVKAFSEHKQESEFWNGASTVASGLRVPKPFADHLILKTLYESGGSAIAVNDAEIPKMVRHVAAVEGVFMCPEGAATVLAVSSLVRAGIVQPADRVLVLNTASGIKYLDVLESRS